MAKALRSQQLQAQGAGADGDSVNLLDPADFFARNYDSVPLSSFLSFSANPWSWTEASELVPNVVGHVVLIYGWAQSIRPVDKKLTFLVLQDGLMMV
jgi:hypothetical protein